jgi:pimeloyl-ACP methyl ester carboxylesterase
MTPRCAFSVVAALVCVATALPVGAQDRPVVFLHGLRSSPDAWTAEAERLRQRVMMTPHHPSLDWRESYTRQTSALSTNPLFAGLPSHTTVAVGHSNGGIVAREWSRTRSLSGIVTLGTPHAGAPLVLRFGEWASFMSMTSPYIAMVNHAFSQPSNTSWVMGNVHSMLGWAWGYAQAAVVDVAVAMAIDYRLPVMTDMRPGSEYLRSLNSSSNLGREAAVVPRRAGIVSVAHNYYWAGPMRAAAPEAADTIAVALYSTIAGLDFWATWILANSDHGDPAAIQQAQALFGLSAHLASIDPVFCQMVSSVAVAECVPNDGVVPHTSQRYPNALNIVIGTDGSWGPAHTRLTEQTDDVLYRTLVEVMQVPARAVPPPPQAPVPTPSAPSSPPVESGTPGGSVQRTDLMLAGHVLYPNDFLRSADGRFDFVYQGDGNLVLYQQGSALWASNTHGTPGVVVMQHDGNFVMYDASDVAIWWSGSSHGHPGAWLIVQDDGNVVIYSESGHALWATGTAR